MAKRGLLKFNLISKHWAELRSELMGAPGEKLSRTDSHRGTVIGIIVVRIGGEGEENFQTDETIDPFEYLRFQRSPQKQ